MPTNLARIGGHEAADDVQKRGFSASRRPHNGDDLTLAEHETQIAHHGRHFVGGKKAFGYVLDGKGRAALAGERRCLRPRLRRERPAFASAR